MKRVKFLIGMMLLAVATSASAQLTNSSSTSSSTSSATDTNGWSTIWVEYNPSEVKIDRKGEDDVSFTGLSVGYSRTLSISSNSPLFVEVGAGFQYSFATEDVLEELGIDWGNYTDFAPEVKTTFYSVKVPVNLMYAFTLPNSNVSLIPFVGANLRFNISGKQKIDWNLSERALQALKAHYGTSWWDIDEAYKFSAGGYEVDVFDKKDMGNNSQTWNRFQLGWHVGLKARFGQNILAGISYGNDFSELFKKAKVATTSITLGYTF